MQAELLMIIAHSDRKSSRPCRKAREESQAASIVLHLDPCSKAGMPNCQLAWNTSKQRLVCPNFSFAASLARVQDVMAVKITAPSITDSWLYPRRRNQVLRFWETT